MPKGKLFEDTFEQLVELGQSTASKTVKSVGQIINPFDKGSSATKENSQNSLNSQTEKLKNKKENHTPLDFEKLKSKLQNKEKVQADALRNRLFQIVRQGDEKMLVEKRQKEMQKKRKEEYEKQYRQNESKKKKQQQSNDVPQGRVRKSIFSYKKTAERSHAETKPATGKQ